MATKTLQQMRNDVLRNIFILATEESPNAGDAIEAEQVITALYEELQIYNLVPFSLTAIPEWAQTSIRDIASFDMLYKAPPSRRAELAGLRELGLRRLRAQLEQELNPAPIKAAFF